MVACAAALACCALGSGAARAVETALSAPGTPEAMKQRLTDASAVMSAQARGLGTVQELLAASLSDYRTLVQVLYDQGYFGPVVHIYLDGHEAAYIKPLNPPARVARIEIAVAAGRPFRFGRAAITPLAEGTDLPGAFAPGQPASTRVLQNAAIAGVRGWRAAGHAKAAVGDQRIVAHHPEAVLDADIRLLPGPLLRFGSLTLSGPTAVRPEAIRRIAGFPAGDIYDPDKVQRVSTRLRRTGAFAAVAIREADRPNPDGSLDFHAEFQDLPPRRLSFGAELSSNTGLDLTLSWTHRNLFGGAERLRLEAEVRNIGGTEAIDGRFSVRLDRPDRFGPDDSLFYLAGFERQNRTHYDVARGLVGIGTRREFSDDLFGEAMLAAAYSNSDDAFGNNRKFTYAILPVRIDWDRRDNRVSATRGHFLSSRVTPFAGLNGNDSGAQVEIDGRVYWSPLESGRLVVAGRLQIGSVLGAAQNDVTPELLFFSGGAGTVRGQPYESLGIPVGAAIAGGRSFLGVSAEVRGQVAGKISVVGFYDFGAVDASSMVGGGSPSHAGAGLGLRYDLGGLGPIRFDLAWPVSGTTGDGMQFYIGIGQAF